MVAVALILVTETFASVWVTLPVAVIIGREILVSALREWMATLGKRADVAVSQLGKVKTALQMLAIILLISFVPYSSLSWVGLVALYTSAVLALWSMVAYLRAAWPEFANEI